MANTRLAVLTYDPASRFDVKVRDIEYRNDETQPWLAHLCEPQGAGPFPMLIDVHGGGWRQYDRLRDEKMDFELASHGIFVASIDFRLSDEAPYPASMVDINFATRWFKAHAAQFNSSPQSVGCIGFSSGGQQVMLASMRPRDPRYASLPLADAADVDATFAYVIMCWPVIDPFARYEFAKSIGNSDLAATSTAQFLTEEGMKEASPPAILERGERVETPPALYLQGTADEAIPFSLAQHFVGAYARAGGHIELYMVPGAPHIFLREESENTRRGMMLIKSFIQRQLDYLNSPFAK